MDQGAAIVDEGIAVLVAAAMAIVGIMYAARQQRRMLRKQHTYQVIEKLNDWKEFDQSLAFASSLIKAGKVPAICDDAQKADCDKIDFLLNHYEFLSSAIIAGDIDEALVRSVEESRLCRVYLKFIDYVRENRRDRGSTTMWENHEFICYRWSKERHDPLDRILSAITPRPSTVRFHQRRIEIDDELKQHSLTIL